MFRDANQEGQDGEQGSLKSVLLLKRWLGGQEGWGGWKRERGGGRGGLTRGEGFRKAERRGYDRID